MTLLFIALGTFFIIARTRTATALAGEVGQTQAPAKAIDWKLWAKIAAVVEVAIAAALVALQANAIDAIGASYVGVDCRFHPTPVRQQLAALSATRRLRTRGRGGKPA